MTPEQAKKLLPFVQAIADGKHIQFLGKDGRWYSFDMDSWFLVDVRDEFRIAARERWVRVIANGHEQLWNEPPPHDYPGEIIHMREVIDDVL